MNSSQSVSPSQETMGSVQGEPLWASVELRIKNFFTRAAATITAPPQNDITEIPGTEDPMLNSEMEIGSSPEVELERTESTPGALNASQVQSEFLSSDALGPVSERPLHVPIIDGDNLFGQKHQPGVELLSRYSVDPMRAEPVVVHFNRSHEGRPQRIDLVSTLSDESTVVDRYERTHEMTPVTFKPSNEPLQVETASMAMDQRSESCPIENNVIPTLLDSPPRNHFTDHQPTFVMKDQCSDGGVETDVVPPLTTGTRMSRQLSNDFVQPLSDAPRMDRKDQCLAKEETELIDSQIEGRLSHVEFASSLINRAPEVFGVAQAPAPEPTDDSTVPPDYGQLNNVDHLNQPGVTIENDLLEGNLTEQHIPDIELVDCASPDENKPLQHPSAARDRPRLFFTADTRLRDNNRSGCVLDGAGQDVGRSCILLRMGGKHIMLDCGMHMGYNDDRRFPDFSYIAPYHPATNYTSMIDCVIISHFHLDHCGALPFFTECLGYDGPVYMTHPTYKIAPILLDDYRKITVEKRAAQGQEVKTSAGASTPGSVGSAVSTSQSPESNEHSGRSLLAQITPDTFFTEGDIKNCMKKVIPIDVNQAIQVDSQLTIRPYYAGHVLGAAMFHIQVSIPAINSTTCPSASFTFHPYNTPYLPHPTLTCVYTGDYNTTPDRHLGPAQIDRCRPDVLITETTYATFTRDSKRTREQAFLEACHRTVSQGGKVLIPVFALGRAQELCILVEGYWERMGRELQNVPVYFSAGLTEKANDYYKMFLQWTNESLRVNFVDRNPFDYKHIRPFTNLSLADSPGPMILFATPGMLHAGASLTVFLKWCSNPLNAVILPGYCVPGTVGARVLAGERVIPLDRWTNVEVKCSVYNMSFSAHADAKGIMSLISACEPKNVVLVHGERSKMSTLKERIVKEKGLPCFDPGNGTTVTIEVGRSLVARLDRELVVAAWREEAKRRRTQIEMTSVGKLHSTPMPIGAIDVSERVITSHVSHIDSRDVAVPWDSTGRAISTVTSAIPLSAALLWDRTVLPRVDIGGLFNTSPPQPTLSTSQVAPPPLGRPHLMQRIRDPIVLTKKSGDEETPTLERLFPTKPVDLGAGILTVIDPLDAAQIVQSKSLQGLLSKPKVIPSTSQPDRALSVFGSDPVGQQWIYHRLRKPFNLARLYLSMLKEPDFLTPNGSVSSSGTNLSARVNTRLAERIYLSLNEYVGSVEGISVRLEKHESHNGQNILATIIVGEPHLLPPALRENYADIDPGIVVVEVNRPPSTEVHFRWVECVGSGAKMWNIVGGIQGSASEDLSEELENTESDQKEDGELADDMDIAKDNAQLGVLFGGGNGSDRKRSVNVEKSDTNLDVSSLADRVMTVVSWAL
ncbi:hypothetical protein HDU93_006690 [Gonapodya sp. JEL0774]|nr:hypothetical protein HDU93_006690 [Gonapodya sp. JEL0774]